MKNRHLLAVACSVVLLLSGHALSQPPAGKVLVLEDFETAGTAARWQGGVEVAQDQASHGRSSGRIRLDKGATTITSLKLPADWRGFEWLRFDIYRERQSVVTAGIDIYDAVGGDPGRTAKDDYFDGGSKILLTQGWNHVEVSLTPLRAATNERDLALDRIRAIQLTIPAEPSAGPAYVDNLRLVSGVEPPDAMSRQRPEETVSRIDNRWISVRQVARPEDVPESAEVAQLRTEAERETDRLQKAIHGARTQGIDTTYAERRLVVADLGLRIRPMLAWFNNDVTKREIFAYVAQSCRLSRQELEDMQQGSTLRREVDDTQVAEPLIPPFPRLKGRPAVGSFFRNPAGDPMLVLSLHSPSEVLQRFFASPLQHIESYTVGGGSRWDIEQSPVYAAFQHGPDTHRVGWDGWCGHLVKDLDSMGGNKKENVVICLESPAIRKAVSEFIATNIPKLHANPELLYNIMAYELSYICYCQRSQQMFRQWLEKKHGTIGAANQSWGTAYKSFGEVIAPPVKNQRPLPGTNRGLWYDWTRFNQDRFTDHLLWVRGEIRKLDTTVPLAAGGSSYMFSGHTGTSGIDEERIVNEVDDVIIHEGAGSTLGMDLQLALSESKKPLADPEMSLRSVSDLLPHMLHGKSVIQLFHWPSQPANEFHSNNRSSLAHSWIHPLKDIDELLRVALDVRRLNNEVAAFAETPAEVAILYSQTSTLQVPPEMLTWRLTPYLAELQKTYAASQFLDAKVTFVTERQALRGRLGQYKLLLVPGVRNLPESVVDKIAAYAESGGHVLILPESLLGDEYNRPRDYLRRFGVTIRETRRPQASVAGAMVQGYDQSFSQQTEFRGGASEKLTPVRPDDANPLETAGVRQAIDVSDTAEVLYAYPDRKAAIVRSRVGKGFVDYSSASLEERSFGRLLDILLRDARVARDYRVRPLNQAKGRVEMRYAQLGTRRLIYVTNFDTTPVELRVERAVPVVSMMELRSSQVIRGDHITVPGRQTGIYEVF